MPMPPMSHPGPGPLWPIHYGPAPIPLRKEPHIPLTPKTGMRREEIERRLSEIDITPEEKAAWNAKYAKPSTGIPKTDLTSGVQASLNKADTALQEHQSLDGYATEEWVEDQGYLTEHQDITGKVDKSALFDNPDTAPKVKSSLLPSYVDDVLEFASLTVFPTPGETGKIYVALDTNKTYRWGGTQYVQVGGDEQAQADWAQTNSSAPDFIKNKPTIPAAQVNADWNASSGVAQILNKPTIPTVPTNVSAFTNDAGYLTQHQSLSDYRTATAQDAIDSAQDQRLYGVENNAQQALNGLDALDRMKAYGYALAPTYDHNRGSSYAVGDYCTNAGTLFKCTTATANPPGAWNAANWTAVAATTQFVPWANAAKNAVTIGTRSGVVGDYSVAQGINVTATGARSHAEGDSTTATEGNAHAEGYSTSATGISSHAEGRETTAAGAIAHAEGLSTYADGRPSHAEGSETTAAGIASHTDGYRAVTAASGSGSSAATPHDYAYAWQGVSTGGYYRSHGAGTFNINPVGGASGFYIGEDSLASLFRYSFASPTPSVSGTSATVACEDRAINDFTVATGITSLTITPPSAVTARARDFFCRVTLTDSSLPTVTLSGGTIDIGAAEVAGMTQGVNLLMLTEISSGHWLASRRSAS